MTDERTLGLDPNSKHSSDRTAALTSALAKGKDEELLNEIESAQREHDGDDEEED